MSWIVGVLMELIVRHSDSKAAEATYIGPGQKDAADRFKLIVVFAVAIIDVRRESEVFSTKVLIASENLRGISEYIHRTSHLSPQQGPVCHIERRFGGRQICIEEDAQGGLGKENGQDSGRGPIPTNILMPSSK
jgi:hypothetical protein